MDGDLQWKYDDEVEYPDSTEKLKKVYTKWATTYDQDMIDCDDVSNKTMVETSIELIDNNEFTQMLDVGAGTGLTAEFFRRAGFKGQIDGVDMSPAMLKMAARKGVYRKTFVHTLTEEDPLPVPNGTYDVVTASGCLMVTHMPSKCIQHILNTLKSGGTFICNSRISKGNNEYLNDLLKAGEALVGDGRMKLIRKAEVPYAENKTMSFVLVYQKI